MIETCIEKIVLAYKHILNENLTGIYIHGSYAMGCFNPKRSDLDFIVVVYQPLCDEVKEKLIRVLLELKHEAPFKGFEMSVVLKKYCTDFIYPTPYELHFSEMYVSSFEKNLSETCSILHGLDYDLAAHFMILKYFGLCVYGEEKEPLFVKIPVEAYLDSIERDIKDSESRILHSPVDVILNLCRVYLYKNEELLSSKLSAGKRIMEILPENIKNIVRKVTDDYQSAQDCELSLNERKEFIEYMKKEGLLK